MKDKIFIRNIAVLCRIGLTSKERKRRQRVIVGVEIFRELKSAGMTDDIQKTINYGEVLEIVRKISDAGEYKLLEHLAERIAARLLEISEIERVDVELKKVKYSRSPMIGIAISRTRSHG